MAKDSVTAKAQKNVDEANTKEIVQILPHLIAVDAPKISSNAFADVETWEDAINLTQGFFGHLISAEELGDGTELVDKATLVDVPFLIVSVSFHASKIGRVDGNRFYCTVRGMTKDNRKIVFSDGSTGICQQLAYLADKHNRKGGFVVAGGLVKSDYTKTLIDESGEEYEMAATTYYLSTQKL